MSVRLAGHSRLQRDRVTGVMMLLYPEGAIELSESAEAVVRLCDGSRSVGEIVFALGEEFEGVSEGEVLRVIDGMVERGLILR